VCYFEAIVRAAQINQTKSNQIKSNQIKPNQIKSNQIKSNQMNFVLQQTFQAAPRPAGVPLTPDEEHQV
jgi:hypothetical protein